MDKKKFIKEYLICWKKENPYQSITEEIIQKAHKYYQECLSQYKKFLQSKIIITQEEIEKYKSIFLANPLYSFWEKYKHDCPSVINYHVFNILLKNKTTKLNLSFDQWFFKNKKN